MALRIEEMCIACDACLNECPNGAISEGDPVYVINPAKCTECVGLHDSPACVLVCPVECIKKDPEHAESPDELADKQARLGAVG